MAPGAGRRGELTLASRGPSGDRPLVPGQNLPSQLPSQPPAVRGPGERVLSDRS